MSQCKPIRGAKFPLLFAMLLLFILSGCTDNNKKEAPVSPVSSSQRESNVELQEAPKTDSSSNTHSEVATLEENLRNRYKTGSTEKLATVGSLDRELANYMSSAYSDGTGAAQRDPLKLSSNLEAVERVPFDEEAPFLKDFFDKYSEGGDWAGTLAQLTASKNEVPLVFRALFKAEGHVVPLVVILSSNAQPEDPENVPLILDLYKSGYLDAAAKDSGLPACSWCGQNPSEKKGDLSVSDEVYKRPLLMTEVHKSVIAP